MNIYINGEARQVEASTLAELVMELGLQQKRIAVETVSYTHLDVYKRQVKPLYNTLLAR